MYENKKRDGAVKSYSSLLYVADFYEHILT